MSVFNIVVDFLPAGTELLVAIKPKGDLTPKQIQHVLSDIRTDSHQAKHFVPVLLQEPLKIDFSISRIGRIHRKLTRCKTEMLALNGRIADSVNGAYVDISAEYEDRNSHGGDVYANVYYKENSDTWRELENRRVELYQFHENECERVSEMVKLGLKPLIRSLPEADTILLSRLAKREDLVQEALQAETQDLKSKVEELNKIVQSSAIAAYKDRLREFRERLPQDIPETAGANCWHNWIQDNRWLFGPQYGAPISKTQVGFHNIPDFLFPTPDGFIDIFEIKLPKHEVIQESKSHFGAYRWSPEMNEAIGQVVNYLYEMELHQLEIAMRISRSSEYQFTTIKPRAFILIGQSKEWPLEKREALRKLNFALHGIEVLTYTELYSRGENLIKMFSDFAE